jgi:hypothetical protein
VFVHISESGRNSGEKRLTQRRKKTLAKLASKFEKLLANSKFHSHLASWRVVISTPAVSEAVLGGPGVVLLVGAHALAIATCSNLPALPLVLSSVNLLTVAVSAAVLGGPGVVLLVGTHALAIGSTITDSVTRARTCASINQSINQSTNQSIHPSIHPIHPSIHPSIKPFMHSFKFILIIHSFILIIDSFIHFITALAATVRMLHHNFIHSLIQ